MTTHEGGDQCNVAKKAGIDADGDKSQGQIATEYRVSPSSVGKHRRRECACAGNAGMIGRVADLLKRSGIDPADIGKVEKVNVWQGFYKDDEGEAHTVDMAGVVLSPTWGDGPEWPVVQPAAPTVVRHRKPTPVARSGIVKTTVLLPDPQIGYLRYDDGTLEPMHDERAMSCALQILGHIRPDRVVDLGDFLDLSEFTSKFTIYPEFVHTTQQALDRGHRFLAEQRAAVGPDAEMDLLGGNHDDRLGLAIARNAKAALRLRPGGTTPESWPVLSIPNLLNLDSVGVTYTGAYPAGRVKVAGAHGEQTPLYALHGEKLDMQKQAKTERHSTVQGHSHHLSCHAETYDYDGTPQQVQSWSVGCLARIDGAVPSTRGAYDERGRPYPHVESWQQAVAVVTETEHGWWLEPIVIHEGRAVYQGVAFCAEAVAA